MANRPIKKFRASNIEGAIWLNTRETNEGEVGFKTASISRNFKKRDEDIWRSEIINLRRGDIPKLLVVLHKIQDELFLTDKDKGED